MNDAKSTTRCEALPWNEANAQRLLDWQPGDAEAAAAIKGMQETYGTPSIGRGRIINGRLHTVWAVGDYVTAMCPDGVQRGVHVIEVLVDAGEDSEYHVAAHVPGKGRQHWAIKNRDVRIF